MAKVFVYDYSRCNGCHNCQLACKDEHVGNEWAPYAKPQPDTGHFWMRKTEKTHGQVPKVRVVYKCEMCNHCADPACAKAGEAVYKREDGLVILDPAKAADRAYVDACPYGAIYWNDELGIAQKCTGCAHLVDEGELPHCVDVCPTGALRFVEESEIAEQLAAAEVEHPEYGTGPRMYYLNNPKLFIGGDVWDPEADEIVEGARVALYAGEECLAETTTDDFGDFWFRQLEPGSYRLAIEAAGYAPVKREVALADSLNVGDFPLTRTAS